MKTSYKRIPFDLETAKRITNGEMKGRIVTEDGHRARIVCWDLKAGGNKRLATLIDLGEYETGVRTDFEGKCIEEKSNFNLHLEVPTYYRDYTNFEPQRCTT